MSTPGGMRVSDAEREQVAARLSAAHVDGRLTLSEFDERVRAAHGAVVREELAPLTADLPEPVPAPVAEERSRPARRPPFPMPVPPMPSMMPPAMPGACGRGGPGPVRAWAVASAVNLVIWVAVVLGTGTLVHPWWIWVAGPWGLMLAAGALSRRRGHPALPGSVPASREIAGV